LHKSADNDEWSDCGKIDQDSKDGKNFNLHATGGNNKLKVSVINTRHPDGKRDTKLAQNMLINLFLVPKYYKKLHHTPLAKKLGIMPDEKHLLQLWQASML
jgi:hypothetical protein